MIWKEHRLVSTARMAFFLLLLIAFPFTARAEVEVTILAQRPDGQAVDKRSALPNYEVIVLPADGVTLVNKTETRNMRDNKEWRVRLNVPGGEEVILKLRRYDGTDYHIEDVKHVRVRAGARYSLVSKTQPVESISIIAQAPMADP